MTAATPTLNLERQERGDGRFLTIMSVVIAAAGVGRLLPLPLLGHWAPIGILFGLLVLVAMGMLADIRSLRGAHPAYLWGAGVLIAAQILTVPIASSAPAVWLTAQIGRS